MTKNIYIITRKHAIADGTYTTSKKDAYRTAIGHFATPETGIDGILSILRRNWVLKRKKQGVIDAPARTIAWKRKYVWVACKELGLPPAAPDPENDPLNEQIKDHRVYILTHTINDRTLYYNGEHWVVNKDSANEYVTRKDAALGLLGALIDHGRYRIEEVGE